MLFFFFFNDTATTEIYTLSLHDALPILTRFSYTPETWARLLENPEDRRQAAQSYIESVGGRLHGFWYAFGEHDGYALWEAPDNASRSEEHTSELQSRQYLVCRLLLEKIKKACINFFSIPHTSSY